MNENKVKPTTLSGFMELLPHEQIIFNLIKKTLIEVYELYGFFPLDTPVLESSEVLLAKAGGETEQQIYRFNKGDSDLTMRFDLTVPLAKYVAKNYNDLTFPFKRYQIDKVYRGERAQKGRFREFYQSDIDIIGDNQLNTINDAEITIIIYNIFTKLGLNDFTIHLNNRKILIGFLENLNLLDQSTEILRIIDKMEKIGRKSVEEELAKLNVTPDKIKAFMDFLAIDGNNKEILNKLKDIKIDNEEFINGVKELDLIVNCINLFEVPEDNYKIDLTIARGLNYYTGTVYETIFNKHPEIGSICSGGRYDNLAEYYTDKKLPGVGISIGLTRLFYILNEKQYFNELNIAPTDILIIPMTEDLTYPIEISTIMRENGIRTQIYFEEKKFKSKIGYASKLSIPFALFIGEDEISANKITIKNLNTGEQITTTIDESVNIIKNYINNTQNKQILDIKN